MGDEEALDRIIRAAEVGLERMLDAAERSDVDVGGLSRTCFEIVLETIAHNAGPRHAPFAQRFDRYRRTTLQVADHLTELSRGWRCQRCSTRIAKGAAISGVQTGAIVVQLICGACSQSTPLAHREAFDALFGELAARPWNPRINGFEWDGR